MPRPLLALVAATLLAGCLQGVVPGYEAAVREADGLEGSLAESRRTLDDALRQAAELTAQARALENESAWLRLQRDDLSGLLNVSEAERAEAAARLDATRAEAAALAANLAAMQDVLANRTLQNVSGELAAARSELALLQARYEALQDADPAPLTSIERGNVTFAFNDLRGDARRWRHDMEEYRQDVKRVRPGESLYLPTATGNHVRVADPRPYVMPEVFDGEISDLTSGRDDRAFVREAFHLKRQVATYSFSLLDTRGFYKYPLETMTEGTGVCGDTVILMASLLLAGDAVADYGYTLRLWIVDYDLARGGFVKDPETANHAVLEVQFRDGERWYLETTSFELRTHPSIEGWSFPIPAG